MRHSEIPLRKGGLRGLFSFDQGIWLRSSYAKNYKKIFSKKVSLSLSSQKEFGYELGCHPLSFSIQTSLPIYVILYGIFSICAICEICGFAYYIIKECRDSFPGAGLDPVLHESVSECQFASIWAD